MTNPIIPVSSAAITDSSGKLTVAGRDFLRQIVAKLQTQINDLSSADSHIADLLASLTDSNGNLLDLSALNVDELVAIAAVQTPGLMVRDALGQWYGRTLTGTVNRLSITYGDGTLGNPVFDIDAAYVGQTSITTLGTIATGTWAGTAIAANHGGTGQTAYAVGDLLYASGASALSKLAAGTATYVLTSNGAGAAPSWQAATGGGGSAGTPPLAANFTAFGAGLTVTDKTGRLQLQTTSLTPAIRGIKQTGIATPYTIDARICHTGSQSGADESGCGLCLSDGTKILQFTFGLTNAVLTARILNWTNATTFSATVTSAQVSLNPSDFYIRITDDGTTRRFWLSGNGLDYFQMYSQATNLFLTPTQFGIASYNFAYNSDVSKSAIKNWAVTASVLGDAA